MTGLFEVGLAGRQATDNDNPNSRGYQEYMDRSEKMTERQFSDFDRIMKKALEFNPDKKELQGVVIYEFQFYVGSFIYPYVSGCRRDSEFQDALIDYS
ncbi:MAG: hypothetical protein ACLUPL_01995 [Butyricimonas virosa]